MNDCEEKSMLGARNWKMRIFLIWTLFPGGWALTGPTWVMAEQGRSLTVSCSYEPGYELYPKYWCRQRFLWFCFTYIIRTNGSEAVVTQGRVSIRDDHTARLFTVMLHRVTSRDTGQYSCGMKNILWLSLRHSTEVMVSAAVSTTTKDSHVDPLTSNPPCPTDIEEPPVLSHLGVIHLLFLLGVKVFIFLVLACGVWVRRQCRSRNQEHLQLFKETATSGL